MRRLIALLLLLAFVDAHRIVAFLRGHGGVVNVMHGCVMGIFTRYCLVTKSVHTTVYNVRQIAETATPKQLVTGNFT